MLNNGYLKFFIRYSKVSPFVNIAAQYDTLYLLVLPTIQFIIVTLPMTSLVQNSITLWKDSRIIPSIPEFFSENYFIWTYTFLENMSYMNSENIVMNRNGFYNKLQLFE